MRTAVEYAVRYLGNVTITGQTIAGGSSAVEGLAAAIRAAQIEALKWSIGRFTADVAARIAELEADAVRPAGEVKP